jgi:hypothetical protein
MLLLFLSWFYSFPFFAWHKFRIVPLLCNSAMPPCELKDSLLQFLAAAHRYELLCIAGLFSAQTENCAYHGRNLDRLRSRKEALGILLPLNPQSSISLPFVQTRAEFKMTFNNVLQVLESCKSVPFFRSAFHLA